MGIITVSRTFGSEGTFLARELARRLNYEYVDRAYIEKSSCEIKKDNVCAFGLEDEASPSFLERLKELISNRSFYKLALYANIYDSALKNNIVFKGIGAHIVLAALPNVINIQVVKPLSERVKLVAQADKVSYDDALKLINKYDDWQKDFFNHYFDKDLVDPTLYHLTINTGYIALTDAADMVLSYCSKHFTPEHTKETEMALKNRLLEKRAEILLFRLGMVHDYGKVKFEAKEEGVLTVKGVIGGEGDKKKLLASLVTIPEVKKIEDQVKITVLSRNIY